VHKWGKINELDIHLWGFFKKAFQGVEQNFVLLFMHYQQSTFEENLEDVKARFEGCSKYIVVNIPHVEASMKVIILQEQDERKMKARSLKCLQDALDNCKCHLITPSLRSTMRKGRLLLLGTSARNMIAKLIINGTLDPNSIIGKKGGQQDETSCSSSTSESSRDITPSLNIPTSEAIVYEELEGKGWQVVHVTLDFHLTLTYVGVHIYELPLEIEHPMLHGSYSHIIYIEQCGDIYKQVKIMREHIT
jgi:hypothetical protein